MSLSIGQAGVCAHPVWAAAHRPERAPARRRSRVLPESESKSGFTRSPEGVGCQSHGYGAFRSPHSRPRADRSGSRFARVAAASPTPTRDACRLSVAPAGTAMRQTIARARGGQCPSTSRCALGGRAAQPRADVGSMSGYSRRRLPRPHGHPTSTRRGVGWPRGASQRLWITPPGLANQRQSVACRPVAVFASGDESDADVGNGRQASRSRSSPDRGEVT